MADHMTRRNLIAGAVMLLSGFALLGTGLRVVGASSNAPAASPQAQAGARYLSSRIGIDGAVAGVSGPDYDGTAQSALAIASSGTELAARDRAIGFLAAHVDDYVRTGGVDQPGRLARLVLLAAVTGHDPKAFGGADLVARLSATQATTGADAGLYGAANPYASSFSQGIVLAALSAIGVVDAPGATWLRAQQCADGSWLGHRASLTTPCEQTTTSTADTNGTAMAVMGLAAQGVAPLHDAIAWFAFTQGSSGWAYDSFSPAPDPNSTALVIQAILAAGGDPEGAAFTKGGVTARAALLAFQLGCDRPAADRGAFWYDFGAPADRTTPNLSATAQAVPALAGQPFPFRAIVTLSTPDPCAPVSSSTSTPAPNSTIADSTTSEAPVTTLPTSTTTTAAPTTTAAAPTTTRAAAGPSTTAGQSTPTTSSGTVVLAPARTVMRTPPAASVLASQVARDTARSRSGLAITGVAIGGMLMLGAVLVLVGSGLLGGLPRRRRP